MGKRDLPRGRSWPLRAAEIARAIEVIGVPEPWVTQSRPYQPDGTVLDARWDHWESGEEWVRVWVHDVPSSERFAARRQLLAGALPDLVEWLRCAYAAPDGWRLLRHRRTWFWTDGEVRRGVDE